jgi:hypothetical protein
MVKSASEILEFIDSYYAHMVSRPTMYASSPDSFEDIIVVLEYLRAFILEDELQSSGYSNFTANLGFGTRHISYYVAKNDPALLQDKTALFAYVADILRKFLLSENRFREEDKGQKRDMSGAS